MGNCYSKCCRHGNDELSLVHNKRFSFEGHWWYYDVRDDPTAPGKPNMIMLNDHESVLLERKYYE